MNKVILTDVDGVLLDWVPSFQAWITETTDYTLDADWRNMYMIHEWYGLEMMDGHNLVHAFNNSSAINSMLPYEESQKYIKKLHEEHGVTFVAITAMGCDASGHDRRLHNLKDLFGDAVVGLEITPLHNDKVEWLNKHDPTYFIEDKPSNAISGMNCGHKSILLNHDHNANIAVPNEIQRVDNWKELYQYLIDNKKHW